MPVKIARLEAGIYHSRLTGTVQLEDLLNSQQQGQTLLEQHGEKRHVLILDIDGSTQMPFDIRQAGQVLQNNKADKVMTVGASFHIKFLAMMLGNLFGLKGVEHFNTVDAAVASARKFLKQ